MNRAEAYLEYINRNNLNDNQERRAIWLAAWNRAYDDALEQAQRIVQRVIDKAMREAQCG